MVTITLMKTLLLILPFLFSCTQKYSDYDLIRKVDFNKESFERPITTMQVLPVGEDQLKACFNQWLFFSNAATKKEAAIPYLIRSLCPSQDYLLNAEMVESWWTTLIFTRSCVSVETKCAKLKRN